MMQVLPKIILTGILALRFLMADISIPELGSIELRNGARLKVSGSWEGGNFNPGNGAVTISGAGISYISGSGLTFANLIIDKAAAKSSVMLQSNIKLDSVLTILSGTLSTGSYRLNLGMHGLIMANPAAIFGTIIPYIETVGTGSYLNEFLGVALSGNPLNNIGSFAAIAYQHAVTVGNNSGINRQWVLSSTFPPSGRNLSLSWSSDSDNGIHTSAQVYRSTDGGQTWQAVGEPVLISALGNPVRTITVSNISGFSSWTVGGATDDQSLPAEIRNFEASYSKGFVHLTWTVENEIENQGFIIARRSYSDADSLERVIGHFSNDAALLGNGSSSLARQMEWQDAGVIADSRYHYTLKSQNFAGIIFTEASVEIETSSNKVPPAIPEEFAVQPLFPNPFNSGTMIDYALPEDARVIITIYDLTGKLVTILKDQVESAAYHQMRWDPGQTISSGIYILVFQAGTYRYSQKLTIIK